MTTTSLLWDQELFRQQAYLGGLWCDADNGATLDVNNPATGEILGCVPLMGGLKLEEPSKRPKSPGSTGAVARPLPGAGSCANGTM